MTRPTWEDICMDLAISISKRSTCSNPTRNVGCVIVDDSHQRVLAWGYNGVAKGENHACEYCHTGSTINEMGYRCNCVHAEQNALIKLNTVDPCRKIMYVTLSPCMMCARLIINAGINEVVIKDHYRDFRPIDLLITSGVIVRKYNVLMDD